MIGLLRGQLVDKRPNQVLVDVNGVGYQVSIPLSSFYALGELRENVVLLIHTHLREDSITLYGFLTSREKHFFELLISASGVGPSLALKILSGMSVDELLPAIRAGDLVRLTRIPGVGRKTAERIVVELRDKLAAMAPPEPEQVPAAGRTQLESDVVSALLNLGYDRRAAEKALEDVVGNGGDARSVASGPETGGAKKSGAEKGAARKGAAEKSAAEKAAANPAESFEALVRAALQQLSHPAKQAAPSGRGQTVIVLSSAASSRREFVAQGARCPCGALGNFGCRGRKWGWRPKNDCEFAKRNRK